MRSLILICFVLFIQANAQKNVKKESSFKSQIEYLRPLEDSIEIDPYKFFPLEAGNFWQYKFLNDVVEEYLVTKDTLVEDSTSYIYVTSNNQVYNRPKYVVDKEYNIFSYHPNQSDRDLYYKLDSKLNDWWWVYINSDSTVGNYKKVVDIYIGSYLGVECIIMEVFEYSRDIVFGEIFEQLRTREALAYGLGLILRGSDQLTEPATYLSGAVINSDTIGTIVGVEEPSEQLLADYSLFQNFPNPFNSSTVITFFLPKSESIELNVYAPSGEKIITVIEGKVSKGEHKVTVDLNNYSSGVYLYSLKTQNMVISKKMIFLK